MNLLSRLLAVGCLLTSAHAFAADAFEGKVTLTMTNEKGRSQALDYTMKGQKMRMDVNTEGHSATMIMDLAKLEMMMMMPEQRMYMVMPMKQAVNKAMDQAEQKGGANADIQRTGKTDKILGYDVEQILVTDKEKGTVTEIWLAPDLGMFMGMGGGMGGRRGGAAAAKWEEALKGHGGFPLRVLTRDPKGNQTFKMEATKIDPSSQPDDLFNPPDGYRKFVMPDMGGLNPFKQG
jgi:Domain of unknown function (DUF4412)